MALKDTIALGMSLPHRSAEPLPMQTVKDVAQRAEAIGFRDLWVTENTLDHVFSLDPMVALTYAGAVTSTIRLGVSVVVLPMHSPIRLAHQVASLDYTSGGRAILGVGIGRTNHYTEFGVPTARRVRRFNESLRLMKALWTQDRVDFHGEIFQLEDGRMPLKPVQKPHPPLWLGGAVPDAIRRAATVADGWMGSGNQGSASFAETIPMLKGYLEEAGRDPDTFPISKRVFMAVDDNHEVAKAEAAHWFTHVYRNADLTARSGVFGTPEEVREQLEALAAAGANHLLLNPVSRHEHQVEALGKLVGLL